VRGGTPFCGFAVPRIYHVYLLGLPNTAESLAEGADHAPFVLRKFVSGMPRRGDVGFCRAVGRGPPCYRMSAERQLGSYWQ
jgi:hypothetical protein